MGMLDSIEKPLGDVFKNAPKLPENAKKVIVQWAPWVALVFGVLSLWSAYVLWHWAHIANSLVNYANSVNQLYGYNVAPAVASRLTIGFWLALIVLTIEAVIYLVAFSSLKAKKKRGWDLLFLVALVNIVYGVLILFTDYGTGSFIGSLIGSVIGLWLLFQIRDMYKKSAE